MCKYLLINGYDRDHVVYPFRYCWSANLALLDRPYNAVRAISATCLLIPREVHDEHAHGEFAFVPKTNFRHAHGLPFPYLILSVDGFQNVYKSTNAASSKAFAHFVFHSYYSSPNGRDYIRMEPMQCERLSFDFIPLAQLSQLSVCILQPSGAMLNMSRDDLRVRRIKYADATATFNQDSRRLLVELSQHFDKNEFYKTDTVRFTGFVIPKLEAHEVNDFVNRPEGHKIVDMLVGSQADDMVDGFYIQVMGDYDTSTGDFVRDDAAVAVLADFNDALDAHEGGAARVAYFDYLREVTDADGRVSTETRNRLADGTFDPSDLGRVINASLQCTVSFRVEVEEEDVSARTEAPSAGRRGVEGGARPPAPKKSA